jgi:hypothetical protein
MKQKIKRLLIKLKKEFHFLKSNQIPILFDHLPKCGGTTINLYLANHYPNRYVFRLSGMNPHKSVEEFRNLPENKRWNTKLVYGHAAHEVKDFIHPDTLSITVFREPVDRIISHYYYVKQTKNHYLHDIIEKDQIQLKDYCSSNLSKELSNWYVTYFTGLSLEEVSKNPEKSIDLALENILDMYDLIGFQEDIPIFVTALKDKLSLKVPQQIDQKNKTKNRVQKEELSQDIIDKISQSNSLDIQLYSKLFALKKNGIIQSNKF